jgi:hypothetical protein
MRCGSAVKNYIYAIERPAPLAAVPSSQKAPGNGPFIWQGGRFEVQSAGTKPGHVRPEAITVNERAWH